MARQDFIKRLPEVFQTTALAKFFEATFDQLFQKTSSQLSTGWLGRRVGGKYDPIDDYFLPEPTKSRTWYQLEPIAYSREEDTTKSNFFFYQDIIDKLASLEGNVENHDRLFASEYYSFAPPIDYDKFLNFQDYYWVYNQLPVIFITGLTDADIENDIIGAAQYHSLDPEPFDFTSGIRVSFPGSASYTQNYTVGAVGRAIELVPDFPLIIDPDDIIPLPWDDDIESSTTVIPNTEWSVQPWDETLKPLPPDYITIERGADDKNAWSTSNKWYHNDVINLTIQLTNTGWPTGAVRGQRPIIEFVKDIELYKSGRTFANTVSFSFDVNYTDIENQTVTDIEILTGEYIQPDDTMVFLNDASQVQAIWIAAVSGGVVTLTDDTVNEIGRSLQDDDVIIALLGDNAARPYYLEDPLWVPSVNFKTEANQAPLFNLYLRNTDTENFDDLGESFLTDDFDGSEIFSYVINEDPSAPIDPILGFPVSYQTVGVEASILFENDLITDRYQYVDGPDLVPITGYYYYTFLSGGIPSTYENGWFLTEFENKQRVIDRYTAGFDVINGKYKLSLEPFGFPTNPDFFVKHNGDLVDAANYSLSDESNGLFLIFDVNYNIEDTDVIEIFTYTHGLLTEEDNGYFEIPQQLEANPDNVEIGQLTSNEFTEHFVSIINNQEGLVGKAFGGKNNYRDTEKDRSLGTSILQNTTSLLKTMLVSSTPELDIIQAMRFAQREYGSFKSKFLKTAISLINRGFSPFDTVEDLLIDKWVEEILNVINISKEFSDAFKYSFMASRGEVYQQQRVVYTGVDIDLAIYANLDNLKNVLYVYNEGTGALVTNPIQESDIEVLLLDGIDYKILDDGAVLTLQIINASVPNGDNLVVRIYEDAIPAYIPSTPSKIGCYPTYTPAIVLDESYVDPTWVIIGHDGSRTPAYSTYDINGDITEFDLRDSLILELEKRIYNGISERYRDEYDMLLRIEDVKSGAFRTTRYTIDEFNEISRSLFSKWATANKLDFRTNEYNKVSSPETEWKVWNYHGIINVDDNQPFPGNWRGIMIKYYDTIQPHIAPWEMLGFSIKPEWWDTVYTADYSDNNTAMWTDLESGTIQGGPRAGVDERFARPNMIARNWIPVDSAGNLRTIPDIFSNSISGTLWSTQFDPWVYGDMAPVEYAWYTSSEYPFSVLEILYLTRPAAFGELYWDTLTLVKSPDDQLVDLQQEFRRKNADIIVHGEVVNNDVAVRNGFQQYITDRLLFLGRDVTAEFGAKIRNLGVNLGHKMASFTHEPTLRTFLDGPSPESVANSLRIPSDNVEVFLHTGPDISEYVYSGVIVRTRSDGTFSVYGYDLLSLEFKIFPRDKNSTAKQITEGGTPASFTYYTTGTEYVVGDIVKYNSKFYRADVAHEASEFNPDLWVQLAKLPVVGGISVSYRKGFTKTPISVPYATVFATIQEVFDFLVGYGDYLTDQGWDFDFVNKSNNKVESWLEEAKNYLFWVGTSWAPDNAYFMSPTSLHPSVTVKEGYPASVERLTNGVYSILDKNGVALFPTETTINRNDRTIQVIPNDIVNAIYYLQVRTKETEHILVFDNITDFNDVIYDPVLRIRQERLRFSGRVTDDWIGRLEAPGYLVNGNELIQNYDNLVSSIREYYNTETILDNVQIEAAARHLIGFENREYLTDLEISDDVQYNFYQGFIKEKGTKKSIDRLLRSDFIQGKDDTEIFEDWAIKMSDFGGVCNEAEIDIFVAPDHARNDRQLIRLNHKKDDTGFIKEILLFNAEQRYDTRPNIIIGAPTGTGSGNVQAVAFAIINSISKLIDHIEITEQGAGYTEAPTITIKTSDGLDTLDLAYAVYNPTIQRDETLDSIYEVDIDDKDRWITKRPFNCDFVPIPLTDRIDYELPNAGYVHLDDIQFKAFETNDLFAIYEDTNTANPNIGKSIWVAKNSNEDWGVYHLVGKGGAITNLRSGKDETGTLGTLSNVEIAARASTSASVSTSAAASSEIDNILEEIEDTKENIEELGQIIVTTEAEKLQLENDKRVKETELHQATLAVGLKINEITRIWVDFFDLKRYNYVVDVNAKERLDVDETTAALDNVGKGIASVTLAIASKENEIHGTTTQMTIASGNVTTSGSTVTNATTPVTTSYSLTDTDTRQHDSESREKINLQTELTALESKLTTLESERTSLLSELNTRIIAFKAKVDASLLDGSGPGSDTDFDAKRDEIKYAYDELTALQETLTVLNNDKKYIEQGTPSVTGEIVVEGITQKSNTIIVTEQLLVIEENKLDQLLAELAVLVAEELPDNISGDLALITVDSSKFCTNGGKNRRYLDTTFNESNIVTYGIVRIMQGGVIDKLFRYKDSGIIGAWVLMDADFNTVKYDEEFKDIDNSRIMFLEVLENLRYETRAIRDAGCATGGNMSWIDDVNGKWSVETFSSVVHRQQEPLVNSDLYINSFIYNAITKDTIIRLPVYDPFKGVIPGVAEQNIEYKTPTDPSRYNHASNDNLIDESSMFGDAEVGQLWWDFSTLRYYYYEQPESQTEDNTSNLSYRRNQWGKLFPGSSVDVYEWIRSGTKPADYDKDGTPKNETDFVEVLEFEREISEFATVYYFWVKDRTSKPGKPNRTLSGKGVASLIANPASFGYQWFAPLKTTDVNDSYVLSGVDSLMAAQETIAQFNYKTADKDINVHAQWKLLREGEETSLIPDKLWNKMVDSLAGYTDLVPLDIYSDAVPITATKGVLPVPDVNLSNNMKYGIAYRPRQSMFVSIELARQIFAQISNELLKDIPARDSDTDWNDNVSTSLYWDYVDWFAEGFTEADVTPTRQIETVGELGLLINLFDGEIVKVFPFEAQPDDRASYFQWRDADTTFNVIKIEKTVIHITDNIYTSQNLNSLQTEIRELLAAFREELFVKERIVNVNLIYFALVNYSVSEQQNLDWIFKTSYVTISQSGQGIDISNVSRVNVFDNVLAYIEEAKPYKTKIREFIGSLELGTDEVNVLAQDDALPRSAFSGQEEVPPLVDPKTGEEIDKTCTWDNNLIEKYLREMHIVLHFNRVEYDSDKAGNNNLIDEIDSGRFIGWEYSRWDPRGKTVCGIENFGGNNQTLVPPKETAVWGGVVTDVMNGGPLSTDDSCTNVNPTNDSIDYDGTIVPSYGDYFNMPEYRGNVPDEMVPVGLLECITIKNEDINNAKFRQHLTPLGWMERTNMNSLNVTTLTTDLIGDGYTSGVVAVADASVLFIPTEDDIGVVWVESNGVSERIEYSYIDGNELKGIRRGTLNTTITGHTTASSVVWDGSARQVIPD